MRKKKKCEQPGCSSQSRGSKYDNFCMKHSKLECEHEGCTTSPQGGIHGK